MHGIRITEQIMHISQNLLISTDQEHSHIVRFRFLQCMHRQIMSHVTGRNKISNLTVRVTSNILQSSRTFRFLIQSLDRHDREYLVNRPRVGKRLEEREITEIFIGKQLRQSAEFIRRMFQTAGNLINLTCNRPIQTLDLCTGFQIYDSMTEQVQRFLSDLLRIVPCFQHLILIQRIPDPI